MSILGVINSDQEVKKLIEEAAVLQKYSQDDIKFFSQKDDIFDFFTYEMPEIVIINFSDSLVNLEEIVSFVQNEKWIFNFGIIGIFSVDKDGEESLLHRYKSVNILTFLEKSRIRSHLIKSVRIIEENYQIIFQREFTHSLLDGVSGSFLLENDVLAIPLYAGIGATILSQFGLINPEHKMQLQLALGELLDNAVEHGNCGITYDEKTAGLEKGLSVVELVAQKCNDHVIRNRRVELLWDVQPESTVFTVRDEGNGFDVKARMKVIESQDLMSLHGRGIKIASGFSTHLKYNAKGNEVTMVIRHDDTVEHQVPSGFSREQVIHVKNGDIILRENSPSDDLFYIISGQYCVYHRSKKVGSLSPQDIFMGEIAFLLGNKRSATVVAVGPGKLVRLSRKTLVRIIHEYPHYGIFISRLLARRIVRANSQNAKLTEQLRRIITSQST
jgi:anti-sigma regulatory factor (Ser/Thr protein kinase)